ncbi:uncharacterized protein PAC_10234 [Phialocephala subalpina]|uniref:rRNA methyltransferase 1, mitochondrial n=1 Tax=Phialocephala subalpina TaxID=576137 RepID=A0A1L7X5N4_9HELO|nr:uncharacterized protein PAC_10234 [Phialocephala subalpina]
MLSHVLSKRAPVLRSPIVNLHRCRYHVGKASSVNTAIERALRKSSPYEGRKPVNRDQVSEAWPASSATRSRGSGYSQRHNGERGSSGLDSSIRDSRQEATPFVRSPKFSDRPQRPRESRFGQSSRFGDQPHNTQDTRESRFGKPSKSGNRPSSKERDKKDSLVRSSRARDRPDSTCGDYPSPTPRERPFRPRNSEGYSNHSRRQVSDTREAGDYGGKSSSSYRSSRDYEAASPRPREASYAANKRPSTGTSTNVSKQRIATSEQPRHGLATDKRVPLSIPYTTPASEFLYGTSVVEAALRSQRTPRRKLYKLYIYSGENREGAERDNQLEMHARKIGVQVLRVGNEGLRLMEKLSSGRPHNGYILEASPLPRLPVTSLGQLTTEDGRTGYQVTVGYQSREEAAVNGTTNFIEHPEGRKPLVLLLDGIVDPQNLGGILRTASFLGASSVAISTRNSAPFSPVVLKASAGASENITLLSVSTPAGFVVESQRAGWKIFAGVAPSTNNDPTMPRSVSTDDLGDPLSESPSILMLGSEGEGLRWNLRSKADVELYIEGCGQGHNVDSLNVGVAAGILCNAFLRVKGNVKEASSTTEHPEPEKTAAPQGDLF